jgi:hypothetical protein
MTATALTCAAAAVPSIQQQQQQQQSISRYAELGVMFI